MPWEPLPDTIGEPERISGPLDAVMARLVGSGTAPGVLSATEIIFDRWGELAGSAMAVHSRPVRVENRRLVVSVTDSAFAAELKWQERNILSRILDLAGSCPVEGLRIVTE
jgi:predicted nucleic acid-binding Zn ribbon protein